MAEIVGFVDIERERDPQPRRAFGHGRRANARMSKPRACMRRRDRHGARVVADDDRQDLRAAGLHAAALGQLPAGEVYALLQPARRSGSSDSMRSASRAATAISGDGAVE